MPATTLTRAISGLHRPVHGEIALAETKLAALPAHRVVAMGVVLVPEGRQVFPELSVLDNIKLGAYLRRNVPPAEIESMFERLPLLRERRHQRAGLLSGGEQQMLAVARGPMAHPRLLLLDEPSLGLAPTVINDLFKALDRLRDEQVTLLLVDQMAGLALSLADRAYVIENGRIVRKRLSSDVFHFILAKSEATRVTPSEQSRSTSTARNDLDGTPVQSTPVLHRWC